MTDMNTHRHKTAFTHTLTHSHFLTLPAIHPLNFYLLGHYKSEKSHSKPFKVFHTLKLLFNFWIPLVIRPHFFFQTLCTPSSYKLKPAASHYWKITLSKPAKQFSVKFYYCGGIVKSSQQLMHPNMDGTAHKINALFETRDEAQGCLLEVLHKVRKLEKEKAHQLEIDLADQRSESYRLKAALREEQTTI